MRLGRRLPAGTVTLEEYLARTPLEQAKIRYAEDDMSLAELEAIATRYFAGGSCCKACGRFPVDDYGLCADCTV